MGEAELIKNERKLYVRSIFHFYGDAASDALSIQIASDITHHWNLPSASCTIHDIDYDIVFLIEGKYRPDLKPETVWYNDDPRLNFFRIEEYVEGNISFVDGIGSNTGYFKLDNLLQTSTTAAHEYGHTIGLVHPGELDVRGKTQVGIMYPRGTLCDAPLQYDPGALAGAYGGFLNPVHRRVTLDDIRQLKLHKLHFDGRGLAQIGEFSSLYHARHIPPPP